MTVSFFTEGLITEHFGICLSNTSDSAKSQHISHMRAETKLTRFLFCPAYKSESNGDQVLTIGRCARLIPPFPWRH